MSAALSWLTATAKADPDRLAVVWNNQELTYAGFVGRIAAVRGQLAPMGLKPGRVVAVAITHLVQSWIATLALQSLGLITLPLRAPEELDQFDLPGLDYLATHAGEHSPSFDTSPVAARLRRIVVHPTGPGAPPADLESRHPPAGGGHILSTSGTTGFYKRVLILASQQEARLLSYTAVLGANPRAATYLGNLGLWTTAGYDGALKVWMEGGAAVLDQRAERHLSFQERRIARARLVPPELETVLNAPEGELAYTPELQLSVIGGALPWRLAEKAMTRMTPQVFSILGSTEVGAISATRIRAPGDQSNYVVHPSRQVEVADEAGDIAPPGTVGQLRIRIGAADADGYLNDEAATRAHFIDGYFYPGDLAVMEPGGRLSLRGRANDVINLRGDKIATLPIEQAIQGSLGARGVCLFSETADDGEDAIHLVLELDRALTEADRRVIASAAPGLDPTIHAVDALPRNDMGKINRIELRRRLASLRAPTNVAT